MVSVVVLTATVLSMPIAGLLGIIGPAKAAAEPTILKMGFMQEIDSLNPMVGLNDASYIYYGLVYDGFHSVQNNYEYVPNIATSTRIVPEDDPQLQATGEPYGSVWEYTITTNATWHDTEPMTVEDVVWGVNLQCDVLNYDSMWAYQPYAYFMHYAEAMNDKTVRIHYYDRVTQEPIVAAYASFLTMPVIPKHKLQDWSPSYIAFNWSGVFEGEDPAVVGTGPFMATSTILNDWRNEGFLNLVRNPNYHWGPERNMTVKFDGIKMVFYDNAQAMSAALKSGEIDIAAFPPQTYRAIKSDVDDGILKNVTTVDGLKCTGYWTEIAFCMNPSDGNNARLDPAVRKALAMTTNKSRVVETYYAGLAQEGSTLISPVLPEWHYEPTESEKYAFDKVAAEALLDSADYPRSAPGKIRVIGENSIAHTVYGEDIGDPMQFEMLCRQEYPEENAIALYLDQQWNQIGIDLNVELVDEATLATIAYSYNYDSLIWYWSSDCDPNYQLFCLSKDAWSGWSDCMYTSKDYEDNYSLAMSALDPAQRKVYVDNCQKVFYKDCAYIILAYAYQTYAYRTDHWKNWGDWSANPVLSLDAFWTAPQLMFTLEPVVVVEPPPPPDDGQPQDNTMIYAIAGIGIAAAVVIAVVAVMLMKRRGGKKEKEGGSPLGD
jgi:peptide/nickel transport system substrate-binding protein